jgi:cellulose synthase/poly-beta-1,6-N-acetylglucosamine synthase-like glycosyltransferase
MSQSDNPFAEDVLFEWKEPAAIRKALFATELRLCLLTLPILFPIFAGFGFFLFAIKVWRNGHSLKEVPFWGVLLVSVTLATIFSLSALLKIVLQRFSPTTVQLETNIIQKRKEGWGREFSWGYERIKRVALTKHILAPEVSAISVTLKTGEQADLGIPDDAIEKALEILKRKGVRCEPQAEVGISK